MLALVVFLNGMAIMVLEMVGARLLAPWLGTSVVVWTSLIGIILASLSLGYWLGGRLADSSLLPEGGGAEKKYKGQARPAPAKSGKMTLAYTRLSHILMAASALCMATALVQTPILSFLSHQFSSLHLAAVLAALTLFAGPGILCGMVSPYAMRLAITSSDTSGSVIGRLNAISTIGSIFGTFLGGFILISWFGSMEIIMGVAACLLAAAALARLKPLMHKAVLGTILILGMVLGSSYNAFNAESGSQVTVETPYSSLVVDTQAQLSRPMRLLMTDPGSCQSGIYLDDPADLAFAYTKYYALGTWMNPGAKNILMLGGGGYSVPKWLLAGRSFLHSKDFTLDVVELDPGMTEVAMRYFGTPGDDPRMRIFHQDARRFLNTLAAGSAVEPDMTAGPKGKRPYDLIFADIFNSYYTVPFHVGTVETARAIRSQLAENGIFIMNIITAIEGDNGRLLRSIHRAFSSVFEDTRLFAVNEPGVGARVQNIMLVAFDRPRDLPAPENPAVPTPIAAILKTQWTRPLPPEEGDVPPLRDNFAPVERYTLGFLSRER